MGDPHHPEMKASLGKAAHYPATPPRYTEPAQRSPGFQIKKLVSALWDIWTEAFSGSGIKQWPAGWHNTQTDMQWLHSSRYKDYFTDLTKERDGDFNFHGWMAPLPRGKNTSLSDCLGQGRRPVMGHVPHREGQVFPTDIFQEQEFSVLKKYYSFKMEPKSEGETSLMCVAIKHLILVWVNKFRDLYHFTLFK